MGINENCEVKEIMKMEVKEALTDMLKLIGEVYAEVEKLRERIEELESENNAQ